MIYSPSPVIRGGWIAARETGGDGAAGHNINRASPTNPTPPSPVKTGEGEKVIALT